MFLVAIVTVVSSPLFLFLSSYFFEGGDVTCHEQTTHHGQVAEWRCENM